MLYSMAYSLNIKTNFVSSFFINCILTFIFCINISHILLIMYVFSFILLILCYNDIFIFIKLRKNFTNFTLPNIVYNLTKH